MTKIEKEKEKADKVVRELEDAIAAAKLTSEQFLCMLPSAQTQADTMAEKVVSITPGTL